jgi:hypothetical protein
VTSTSLISRSFLARWPANSSIAAAGGAFAEFCRVLAPGGLLLLASQAGDESLHLAEALGHPVSLAFRHSEPERVAELLSRAGLVVRARLLREPDNDGDFTEREQQAFLLAP